MTVDRIMPFLWIKGESTADLEKELYAMLDMGITSLVVESRVHNDFCGPAWFQEMDFILEFAKAHSMKVWLLDDKFFPSGYANGALVAKGLTKKARRLKVLRTDISGKKKDIRVRIQLNPEFHEELFGVYLAKRGENYRSLEKPIDITDNVHGDWVYLDIDGGSYSVLTVIETSAHAEWENHIDMMDSESVKMLIDAVYEPHYERYKDYFGTVFCGFFSDEPRFNCSVYCSNAIENQYSGKIGKYGVAYPWNKEVQKELGVDCSILALWFDIGEGTAEIRCRYMELVTDCYARNFVEQLGRWCHERGVLYTGHIIEDMNAHTSLVWSAGHYFKAMKGADIASVDVVLHQIKPFEDCNFHKTPTSAGYVDPNFFNYTLMKLASSDSHIDSKKKGRALCEIFGAYGWGESMSEMIYLANHSLVRGVNHFIPHAFTSEFDNRNCPPHFYAGGLNPSDIGYRKLFDYMNTVSGLFSDGKSIIETAVLYHAQTEWSGGSYDPCDVIARELTENQVDFDFVDFGALSQGTLSEEGIVLGDNVYRVLLVPYFERLPREYRTILTSFGDRVLYASKGAHGFGETVKAHLGYAYESKEYLRVLRYEKNQKHTVMFLNEGEETIWFCPQDYCQGFRCGEYANDYLAGTYLEMTGNKIPIEPLQALICEQNKRGMNGAISNMEVIVPSVDVYLKRYDDNEYQFYKHTEQPFFNINRYDECPAFSGHVKVKPHMEWADIQFLKVEYDAEFCDLHIGNHVFSSIGGQLYCDLREIETKNEEAFFVLGSGLGNVLKDKFSDLAYLSPCKLISIAGKSNR